MLSDRSYDLVIVMMRIADMDPITFGEKVKAEYPDKPIVLLAFDESEITSLTSRKNAIKASIKFLFGLGMQTYFQR